MYSLHLSTFNPPALVYDLLLLYFLNSCAMSFAPEHTKVILGLYAIWLLLTKTVKLFPHFSEYPQDLVFVPIHIAFGYFHGLVKIYALLTLWKTDWEHRSAPHVPEEERPMLKSPSELTLADAEPDDSDSEAYFERKVFFNLLDSTEKRDFRASI